MDKFYLECKFCKNQFDTGKRLARMLFTCGHSICTSCLETHLKTHVFIVCPEDQKRISMEDVTIDKFPPNAIVLQILNRNKMNDNAQTVQGRMKTPNPKQFLPMQGGQSPRRSLKNELQPVVKDLDKKSIRSDKMSISNKMKIDVKEHFSDTQSNYRRRTSEQGYDSPKSKVSVHMMLNSQDMCHQHGKPMEAVCVNRECGVRVCLECGIFGEHKVILSESQYQERVRFNERFRTTLQRPFFANGRGFRNGKQVQDKKSKSKLTRGYRRASIRN